MSEIRPSSISSKSSGEKTSSSNNKKSPSDGPTVSHQPVDNSSLNEDDAALAARMGHKSEFAREFKSFSTISYAFSIMVSTTERRERARVKAGRVEIQIFKTGFIK